MPNSKISEPQCQSSTVIHCVLTKTQQKNLPLAWRVFLTQQTLPLDIEPKDSAFHFHYKHLTAKIPERADTLIEQMAWAVLSNPDCQSVIWPLFTSIDKFKPLSLIKVNQKTLTVIEQQGFIALCRTKNCDLASLDNHSIQSFSQALIAEHNIAEQPLSFSQRLKNNLTLEQKIFLKRKLNACRELLSFPFSKRSLSNDYLAYAKFWPAEFLRPQLALNPIRVAPENRIPILIATHWLELGGAEKFAIDLIKALPKEDYAIYVTTDVASFNHWSCKIADQVDAIFHLPGFLTPKMMMVFYEYLIRSRNIRIMHIHHAFQAYQSLYHIRRFHPHLHIVDSLHITELPPNEGGYVESSARDFEAFINHHHVISHFLKNFLMQRWHVPENKISVIYLNVDSDYFNPAIVKKGQIRNKLNIPDNACLVGFLGRFSQQKQPLEFIKTARLLQQRWRKSQQSTPLVFLMTGSGLLEPKIKRAIRRTKDTTILLHPQIHDTRPIYQDCDVLMMPSENEGLALVSYEAMSMQTPIFFTDVGAQRELMDTDFLIEISPNMAEKFADAMWPYLIDAQLRQQAGIKMRNYIREHHHHQQTYSQLLTLYQQLLSSTTK